MSNAYKFSGMGKPISGKLYFLRPLTIPKGPWAQAASVLLPPRQIVSGILWHVKVEVLLNES
jgi:hypothetical protein